MWWWIASTTPQSKPLIYNGLQRKNVIPFDSHHDYPHLQFQFAVITISAIPFKNRDFTQPGVILDFTTDPINTNQYSGNHPPTKILDKRTTWILVKWHNSNLLRSQTSISDHLLKSLILSTNESWSPVNRIEHRTNMTTKGMTQTHVPPVNHTHHPPVAIRIPTPASTRITLPLSIVKHRA